MATYELPINSLYTESGDDVYAKPLDGNFSGTNWPDDSVAAIEVADTNVYEITLDETKGYVIYLNGHSQSFTVDASTDVITANAHGLTDGATLRFKGGDLPAPLVQVTVYYLRDVTTNTFKLAATAGGPAINITDTGSGTMTFTAPSKRSKAGDTKIGTVPQVRDVALTAEGEESIAGAVIAAFKDDPVLGTDGLVADAESSATQTTGAAIRASIGLESANMSHLFNAVVGKNVVTDNGDGTFDVAVRNAADDATLVTVRYNPTTGNKTVVS